MRADGGQESLELELCPEGWFEGARVGVTTRTAGVSGGAYTSLNLGRSVGDDPARVAANESRVLRHLGLEDRVARLKLEHGRSILTTRSPGLHGPADALATDDPGLILWLTVADCVPVALQRGAHRVLAHCGWRGVALGLPGELGVALSALDPRHATRAWIGPGIRACCYAVGEEVARQFPESALVRDGSRMRLDLAAAIRGQLEGAGLEPTDIAGSRACTSCDADRFYSHRRDGFPSGRMAAVFWPEGAATQQPTPPSTSL